MGGAMAKIKKKTSDAMDQVSGAVSSAASAASGAASGC